jgi:hypothetical protein
MFDFGYFHSSAPLASLTASSDSSDGGSSLIVIALIAVAVAWVVSLLGSTANTVVVVEKPAGSFLGFVLIAVALGVLYFLYIAPATGQI